MPAPACPPIGLQLFTVRDFMARDVFGTLERVAALGFEGVEFAGLFDQDPAKVRARVEALGLRVAAAHYGIDRLAAAFDECVNEACTLGAPILVVPYLTEEHRTLEGYRLAAAQMVTAAERLAYHGLRLAYHHHAFEFDPLGPDSAQRGIDVIVEAPADSLLLEIDVYWCRHGGTDPVRFLARHLSRTPLLHLKDMKDAKSRAFAEIGTGIIDFPAILRLAASSNAAVEWLLVEQDSNFAGDALQSAATSLTNLRALCRTTFT